MVTKRPTPSRLSRLIHVTVAIALLAAGLAVAGCTPSSGTAAAVTTSPRPAVTPTLSAEQQAIANAQYVDKLLNDPTLTWADTTGWSNMIGIVQQQSTKQKISPLPSGGRVAVRWQPALVLGYAPAKVTDQGGITHNGEAMLVLMFQDNDKTKPWYAWIGCANGIKLLFSGTVDASLGTPTTQAGIKQSVDNITMISSVIPSQTPIWLNSIGGATPTDAQKIAQTTSDKVLPIDNLAFCIEGLGLKPDNVATTPNTIPIPDNNTYLVVKAVANMLG